MAPTREDAEDALHSRLNAAVVDQILIGVFAVVVGLVLQLAFASVAFAGLAIGAELLYFFVQETRTGQTIGKRQYGVRVVNLDGTRPGPRTIAFRTLGRILDTLPAYHASGLLTMIGTGRRRRQRIGDMLAHTTVVAAPGGRPLAPRRRWLLPLLTVIATAISVGVIVEAVDRASSSDALRSGFVSGCEQGGYPSSYCGCMGSALVAAGYTNTAAWQSLENDVHAAQASEDPALLPAAYVSAVQSCGTP
jgi:uncharacterized RDD family membrane protein YckC